MVRLVANLANVGRIKDVLITIFDDEIGLAVATDVARNGAGERVRVQDGVTPADQQIAARQQPAVGNDENVLAVSVVLVNLKKQSTLKCKVSVEY